MALHLGEPLWKGMYSLIVKPAALALITRFHGGAARAGGAVRVARMVALLRWC